MKYIRKLWVRIILSLLTGAFFAELVHVRTGHQSIEASNLILVIGGMLTFFLLSTLVWFDKYKYYFFPHWDDQAKEEDILDDMD